MDDLVGPSEAAARLGVTLATLARWADAGRIACVKTAGGHRRFLRAAVEALRMARSTAPSSSSLHHALIHAPHPQAVLAVLLSLRAQVGSWSGALSEAEAAVSHLRVAVHAGRLSRLEARVVTERMARALSYWCDGWPRAAEAPLAMLVNAEGEDVTLPLSMVEAVLAENGMRTLWLGRRVSVAAVARALKPMGVHQLVVHASGVARQGTALAAQAETLAHACRVHHVQLLLWGGAPWPADVQAHAARTWEQVARRAAQWSRSATAASSQSE